MKGLSKALRDAVGIAWVNWHWVIAGFIAEWYLIEILTNRLTER